MALDNQEKLKSIFDEVYAGEERKVHTKAYLRRRFYEKQKKTAFRAGYAVACSLLLMFGIGGYTFYFMPVTYISIDINPSIGLELNRIDRIIRVTPYNEDGVAAVKNLDLKNRKYDEGILALLESRGMSAYLSKEANISFAVASEYEDKNAAIQTRMMECTMGRYGNVSCHASSREEVQKAHHAGLSFGKYRAFLELQAVNPELTTDDVKEMSMHEIQEILEGDSCGNGETDGHGSHRGHGNGCR